MQVTVRRDVVFTRIVSQTPSGDVVSSPWMPVTRINAKEWQLRGVERRGDRPIYRINARPKPPQEAK